MTIELSNLHTSKGARKSRRRVGRGESSGAGKTSGRGGKGQTARTGGGVRAGFEGGQMPLYRRIPKLGFFSQAKVTGKNSFQPVNLSVLDRFESGAVVDEAALLARGYGRTNRHLAGFKILGDGTLTKKLSVKVSAVSNSARQAIEGQGGSVELLRAPKQDASEKGAKNKQPKAAKK